LLFPVYPGWFLGLNRHLDHIQQGVYLFFLIFFKPGEFETGHPGWGTMEGMIFCEGDDVVDEFARDV
jgi:hypothetical protein